MLGNFPMEGNLCVLSVRDAIAAISKPATCLVWSVTIGHHTVSQRNSLPRIGITLLRRGAFSIPNTAFCISPLIESINESKGTNQMNW